MTDEPDRILDLEGIHNFRDYGGYAAAGGTRVRRGLLWRSGQHCGATPADLDAVARLGLRTVIDLRGDGERARYPCLRPGDFAAEVLFAPGETARQRGAAVHEEAAGDVRTVADARAIMLRTYESLAWRPVLVATFRLYFAALAERDGASLLHCLAGKDRTGLAAALAHHVLGVHPDDAMADYMLTNVAGDPERRIAALNTAISPARAAAMEPGALRTLLSVHPSYLDTALAAIRARDGSLDAYLEGTLGVTAERRAAVRARLLE
ncbi:MAG: tyrosine-protein phosphatase [Novosphingobium sp.]